MSEIERLRDMLTKRHVPFTDTANGGINFWLGGNECWANPTKDGGLYGGVGLLPWQCCQAKNAEKMLHWCMWNLGLEDA